jgi:hypothetical protein
MHAILEQLYEDLNSYSETSITLDPPHGSHFLDLRLFPHRPNPSVIRDDHVPLLLVPLLPHAATDGSWDLTLARMAPFIDGVRPVREVARKANVDRSLAREAVQHLVYYNAAVLVDLFSFENSYALVQGPDGPAAVAAAGSDDADEEAEEVRRECVEYVSAGDKPGKSRKYGSPSYADRVAIPTRICF